MAGHLASLCPSLDVLANFTANRFPYGIVFYSNCYDRHNKDGFLPEVFNELIMTTLHLQQYIKAFS
ncbi:hypothetical protein OUZ56_003939 [Daphnia magna]|uniref:Uncharacterized protein n=1 Tax=Daphnia magna TaxID=35525 RepID=A0ABQ9YN92_9CRUS|nr:hypothetical protein OUZ56_003939 [Daphnia magna]